MNFLVVLLIMILAVLLADIIAHFVPVIATPIIQIALGAAISFIPIASHFHIGHEYFHLLFIAPLAYFGGMEINKKQIWKMKGSIANMAIVLVAITGIIVAAVFHSIIPSVAIIVGLTLMSALGPTDHIAVDAVERHSNIPERLMELLKSESIFAEVTSVVLFQTFLSAVGGEHINPGHMGLEFIRLAGGGIIVGAILAFIKLIIVRFITAHGINQTALHTLIRVVFPLFAYIIAEHFEVSGIVSIFVAGIISTFEYKKGSSQAARLDLGAEHVWEFLSFTLDGLIFVSLGMQVPHILEEFVGGHMEISYTLAILVILAISGVIFLVRYLWSLLTLPKYSYEEDNISRPRAALLFSMSGARGAITWASIGSIPAVLANGLEFPHHELITVISMGVIIVSILGSYIALPLIAPIHKSKLTEDEVDQINVNILNNVAKQLQKEATSENKVESSVVIYRYRDRADDIQMTINNSSNVDGDLDYIARKVVAWNIENVERLKSEGKISAKTAEYVIHDFDRNRNPMVSRSITSSAFRDLFRVNRIRAASRSKDADKFLMIATSNTEYILDKLNELKKIEDTPAVQQAIDKYQFRLSGLKYTNNTRNLKEINKTILAEVEERALEIERELIQDEYEAGNLSYEKSKELKANLAFLELGE